MMSKETRLSNLIANLDQFQNVYNIKSKHMDMFLGDAKIDTEVTSEIYNLRIISPEENKLVCF